MSVDIRNLEKGEIEQIILDLGEPKYRASQVFDWLHTQNVASYDEMTNIPKALREKLSANYPLKAAEITTALESTDGSVKFLITYADGVKTEAVGIVDSSGDHVTVCVSSQVGCAMECVFCATGQQKCERNLTSDEIVEQVILVGNYLNRRVSNVVFMGQGEPFLNYNNVIGAIKRLNQDKGLNIGARHMTISTSGIVEGIYAFAEESEQFRLAISLHSADVETRNALMPRLSGQPLHSLKKALKHYCDTKGRRVTIEYLLLKGVNDSEEQLQKLVDFCEGLNAHVNILEYNKVKGAKLPNGAKLEAAPRAQIQEWLNALQQKGITASLRHSKGADVAGACGQLINPDSAI